MQGNCGKEYLMYVRFVMNDELWNLMPMDSSLNSSKNNKLPKWEPFFEIFAGNQFIMYKKIYFIHNLFIITYYSINMKEKI